MHPHNIIANCLGLINAEVKVFRPPLDSEKLDKFGKIAFRSPPLLTLLMVASLSILGCSYGADLSFIRPRLQRITPTTVIASSDGRTQLRLDLILLDQQDRTLRDSHQVHLTSRRSFPLSALRHDQFGVHELRSTPTPGVKLLGTRRLGFVPFEVPAHLVLVLDNSLAALESDPRGTRITASKALLDHLLCGDEPGCSFPDQPVVSIVALQDQGAAVVARASRDRRRLYDLLSKSEKDAGGTAPLWDGLVKATQLASGTGPSGVILYWASSQGATAPPEQVTDQLSAAGLRLMVVHTGTAEPDPVLSDLVRQNGGAELVATPGLVELLVAAEALLGSWQLELDVADLPSVEPGVRSKLSGRISLDLEDHSWESAFTLPVQSVTF
jgi:hypothetical protein